MKDPKSILKQLAARLGYEIVKRGTVSGLTLEEHVAEVLERAEVDCVVDAAGSDELDLDLQRRLTAGVESRVFVKSATQQLFVGVGGRLDRVVGLQTKLALRRADAETPSFLDALAFYEGLGYAVTGMFPVARDDGFRVVELECVMVRPAKKAPAVVDSGREGRGTTKL